jgi:hypothetical protein
MMTESDAKALIGKEILVSGVAFDNGVFHYYIGTVRKVADEVVYLHPMYYVGNSHTLDSFTKKTRITVRPKCPGFFKAFAGRLRDGVSRMNSFLLLKTTTVLEVNENRQW